MIFTLLCLLYGAYRTSRYCHPHHSIQIISQNYLDNELLETLRKLHLLKIYSITNLIIKETTKLVYKYHAYHNYLHQEHKRKAKSIAKSIAKKIENKTYEPNQDSVRIFL